MATVLVLAAGRRDYVVRGLLAAARPEDVLLVSDADPLAAALGVPGAEVVIEPPGTEAANTWLLDICRVRAVDAVLCLHDYRGLEVGRLREDLVDGGTLVLGPCLETAEIALDKIAFHEHLRRVAPASAIPTWPVEELSNQTLESHPRWVVKDRFGSGSSGLLIVDAMGAVQARHGAAEAVAQPCLTSAEWNVDLFVDVDGRIVGQAAKRKLRMRSGETDAAVVVPDPPAGLIDACRQALRGLTVTGNVDIDVFAEPDGYKVVDLNPRFGGGYAFSLAAGYEAAGAVWSLAARERLAPFGAVRPFVGAKTISVVELDPDVML